jgi:hypothetical protein
MTEFVVPSEEAPRDVYRAEFSRDESSGWPKGTVSVYRKGEESPIFEYSRNYALMKTFEPFRQLRNGVWSDYALISQRYTKLDVLDLQTGTVIATEEPSDMMLSRAQALKDKYYADKPEVTARSLAESAGFCPVEFYVPDWREVHDGSILPGDQYWDDYDGLPTGEFGIYSGCVWGDDSSWKVRYIDLSRISEGIVTTDERFGYVELFHGLSLRESASYLPSSDAVEIAMQVSFNRTSGLADAWIRDGIRWTEKAAD